MRILQEEDRKLLEEFLYREPEMNLFLIGDLENYGINSEAVSFYLHEEKRAHSGSVQNESELYWDFVILRFYQSYILYSPYEDYNAEEAIQFLKTQNPEGISGREELLKRISPAFPQWELQSDFMSRCNRIEDQFQVPEELEIRVLGAEDMAEAVDLLYDIEEFKKGYEKNVKAVHIRRMQEEMEQGGKLALGGYRDGRLVSIAETSAENTRSAMVVGVATKPEYRKRGYASAVVSALCRNCFDRGKEFLCLFYDNPAAGRIYNKIGFVELGKYGMLR